MSGNPRDVIHRPIVTEASMNRLADGKYTFQVAINANKTQIKQAIQDIFKVKVQSVNTSRLHGKVRRQGRSQGRLPDWKKAIVTLQSGEKIAFFEGMSQ